MIELMHLKELKKLIFIKPMACVNALFAIIDTLWRYILDFSQKYVMIVMQNTLDFNDTSIFSVEGEILEFIFGI